MTTTSRTVTTAAFVRGTVLHAARLTKKRRNGRGPWPCDNHPKSPTATFCEATATCDALLCCACHCAHTCQPMRRYSMRAPK